ncbi:class I SAM-dependent methyltransferase [Dyella sp.]|uniref:class I SAM-dependent methyltransferase n=1 Tax=Dyella sp. TaxID=1869338 RepID=UPI002ED6328B
MKPLYGMDIYDDAAFYDREFATRDHDVPFFLKQAQLAGGPVLEVACGTGRITLPLARAGIDVAGLDVSRPMLERAQQKSQAEGLSLAWLEQDCRHIEVEPVFALVFSATNAMQHLHDVESALAFLTSARKALRPGGILLLDVANPDVARLARPAGTRYVHKTFVDDRGREVRVELATHYEAASQILAFTLHYLVGDVQLRTKSVRMRCYFPEEMLALCRCAGLDVVRRLGNYDESPFVDGSPKQLLFCRAAEGLS